MSHAFDAYDKSYGEVVQSSIAFAGLPHDFYLRAKAGLIRGVIAGHFGERRNLAGLDVGCGVGKLHPLLDGTFGHLTGIDISAPCIAEARRNNPSHAYSTYEGKRLPFGDQAFDFVLAVCMMHHVARAERAGVMDEMRRVARPDGLVCIIEHNPLNPLTQLAVRRCAFDHDAVLLRAGEIAKLMRAAGLREVTKRYFLFMPTAATWSRNLERRLGWLPLGAQHMMVGVA